MDHHTGAERCSAPVLFLLQTVINMYNKKAKITQAVYEAALPVCFTVVSSLNIDINVALLFFLFLLFFCIPMVYTSFKLSKGFEISIKECIIHDLVYVLLPFIVSALVVDICVSVISGAQSWTGMTAFILVFSALLITAVFWLKYLIDKKLNNRP